MRRIAFCETCDKDTEYDIRNEAVEVDLDGMKFSYNAYVAYCKECNREVYVPEINDLNLITAFKTQKEILEKEAAEKDVRKPKIRIKKAANQEKEQE